MIDLSLIAKGGDNERDLLKYLILTSVKGCVDIPYSASLDLIAER